MIVQAAQFPKVLCVHFSPAAGVVHAGSEQASSLA